MKSLKSCLALTCALGALTTFSYAGPMEQKVRMDIASSNLELTLEDISAGGHASTSASSQANGKTYHTLTAEWDATKQWQTGSITFLPSADGYLTIMLMGPYVIVDTSTRQLDVIRACFDDIESSELVIRNGRFDRVDESGVPEQWVLNNIPGSKPAIDADNTAKVETDSSGAQGNYVSVWHNSRFFEVLEVTGGKPVTITFSYRLQ